jgi:hypothetical protein
LSIFFAHRTCGSLSLGERAGVRGNRAFPFPRLRTPDPVEKAWPDVTKARGRSPSPLNGERAGVRGEKLKGCHATSRSLPIQGASQEF